MPYITQEDRKKYNDILYNIKSHFEYYGISPGNLNYLITMIIHEYIGKKGLSYTHLNDVVGVLESAKAEFQRTVVANYEDKKISENGDL